MTRKLFIFTTLIIWAGLPLFADEELPVANIDVKLSIASNYVVKGTDKFSDYANQKKKQYSSHSGAPLFQPTISYKVPEPGLFFKIEGFMAMTGRQDQDVDQVMQQGPGGEDIFYNKANFNEQFSEWISRSGLFDATGALNPAYSLATGSFLYPECKASTSCQPNYYKEKNGLFRSEEVKAYLGYKRSTNVGKFSFALKYTIPTQKDEAKDTTKGIIFDYSLPFLEQLSFYMEHTLKESANYYQIKWSDNPTIAQLFNSDLKFVYMLGVGYGVRSHLQGVQDVSGRTGLWYQGFGIGVNVAWRPDLRFHDTDSQSTGSDRLPVWLYGNSSRADGRVADPSRKYGHINQYVNRKIQEVYGADQVIPGYRYTPRQSLPRYLIWVDLSYSFKI